MKELTGIVLATTMIVSSAACGNKVTIETAAPTETAKTEETKMEEAKKDETKAKTKAEMSDVKRPTGPVPVFVSGKTGANLDTKAHPVARYLSLGLGVDVVVNNRSGAGGVTARIQYLVEEASSNNTEYMVVSNPVVASIYNDCEFAADDSVTVAGLDSVENGLFMDAKLGIKTLEELKTYVEGKTVKFASAGVGNNSFLASKAVMEGPGITSDSVNDDGFGDALVNVMNGSAEVCYCALNQASQYVKDGSIVPLAVYSKENYMGYADLGFAEVPTLKSVGVDVSYPTITWFSLRAGAGQATIEELVAALQKVYDSPEFQVEFTEAGFAMLPDVSTVVVSKRVDNMTVDCAVLTEKIGN